MAMESKSDDNKYEEDNHNKKNVIYVPSNWRHNENSVQEKFVFGGKYGERRERVEPYQKNTKPIMKCIGRIETSYGDKDKNSGNPLIELGTGTVYHVKDNVAYIITCAHNVCRKNQNKTQYPISVKFTREVSAYGEPLEYPADVVAVHPEYLVEFKGDLLKVESNDLAILRIHDDDKFYGKIFNGKSDVNLKCSDDINGNSSEMIYYLYGYPCVPEPKINKASKANDGELWGMKAKSYKKKDDIEWYVKKSENGKQFEYNAIDTEGGQSGASLFIELSDGKSEIVGIHTIGSIKENSGVALNGDKIKWLNENIYRDPIKSNPTNEIKKIPLRILEATPCYYQWAKPENILKSFKQSP